MHEYDVALSFAGENRYFVEQVATCLLFYKIKVFYDDFETVNLWGKNLYTHFSQIYEKTARYVVIFASEHYARKAWANHELQSAQARALNNGSEYILPARFDDTEIPGLLHTTHYIDLRKTRPDELARLIVLKIKGGSEGLDLVNNLDLPNFTFSMTDGHQAKTRPNGAPWYNKHVLDLLIRPSKNRLEIELQKAERTEPKDILELSFVFAEQRYQYVYTLPEQLLFGFKQIFPFDWVYQAIFGGVNIPRWIIDGQHLVGFLPPLSYLPWIHQDFEVVSCGHQTPRSGTNDPSNSMALSFKLQQP